MWSTSLSAVFRHSLMTVWMRHAQTLYAAISAFRTNISLASPAMQKTLFPCCWFLTLGQYQVAVCSFYGDNICTLSYDQFLFNQLSLLELFQLQIEPCPQWRMSVNNWNSNNTNNTCLTCCLLPEQPGNLAPER